jgi:hypothetical protein
MNMTTSDRTTEVLSSLRHLSNDYRQAKPFPYLVSHKR